MYLGLASLKLFAWFEIPYIFQTVSEKPLKLAKSLKVFSRTVIASGEQKQKQFHYL
jgi:hypothetical protein